MKGKRGVFLDKKGSESIESEIWFIIFEFIILAIFALTMFAFMSDVEDTTLFEKNYLARDLALMVNTMYTSPQNVIYAYPEDLEPFIIKMESHRVRVKMAERQEDAEILYWYADEEDNQFNAEQPLEQVPAVQWLKWDELKILRVD